MLQQSKRGLLVNNHSKNNTLRKLDSRCLQQATSLTRCTSATVILVKFVGIERQKASRATGPFCNVMEN